MKFLGPIFAYHISYTLRRYGRRKNMGMRNKVIDLVRSKAMPLNSQPCRIDPRKFRKICSSRGDIVHDTPPSVSYSISDVWRKHQIPITYIAGNIHGADAPIRPEILI